MAASDWRRHPETNRADRFGPRFIGRAGMRVPAFRVIAYVARIAESPTEHPSALHAAVLGV